MDKKEKKKIKKPVTFLIGVVYEGKNIEAVSLYDRETKKGYLQSLKNVVKRIQNGEKILGISVRDEVKFVPTLQDFKIVSNPVLDKSWFNYKEMNILNGAGEVVFPGKDVIVGTLTEDDTEYCVVVNSNYELRKIKKEDAIQQKLIGTFRKTILKICSEPISI